MTLPLLVDITKVLLTISYPVLNVILHLGWKKSLTLKMIQNLNLEILDGYIMQLIDQTVIIYKNCLKMPDTKFYVGKTIYNTEY